MAAAFAPDRDQAAERAGELRARALELAEIELHAYEPVLEALRLPREDPERADRVERRSRRGVAFCCSRSRGSAPSWPSWPPSSRAPGIPNLAGDAIAGALLAEASAQAAARLVAINLTDGPAVREATDLALRALIAREEALHSITEPNSKRETCALVLD